MRDREEEIHQAGAAIAAIGLGDRYYAAAFEEESEITFPLLIDEDRRAYRAAGLKVGSALHLLRPDNGIAAIRAQAAGHRQHRLGQNPFQLGGAFIFGPGDVDLYGLASKTFYDHPTVDDLLAALR